MLFHGFILLFSIRNNIYKYNRYDFIFSLHIERYIGTGSVFLPKYNTYSFFNTFFISINYCKMKLLIVNIRNWSFYRSYA